MEKKLQPGSYCDLVNNPLFQADPLHKIYHDTLYGFPIESDNELFCRLILEINQAGLNWLTILRKESSFRKAYREFDIGKVARFNARDKERLLQDAGIIRNRLKIEAAIENAKTILQLQQSHGSFLAWLESHHPKTREEWTKLFKNTFRFTGGEIVNEFLMSTGFLPGAHTDDCPIHKKILKQKPAWKKATR
jgi:DNA-3-methyladenine glycosylase I